MKAVMISVRPNWCAKITNKIGIEKNGKPIYEKTVEVRKTRPKNETPFKCYIYCTLPPKEELFMHGCIREYANELIRLQDGRIVYDYGMRLCCDPEDRPYSQDNFLCKKVIGEFVCDRIEEIGFSPEMHGKYICKDESFIKQTCIPFEQMFDYLGDGYGYGWHISDLVIYDKPKELSEFYHYCGDDPKCDGCKYLYSESNESVGLYEECCSPVEGCKPLTRPPQSWCYVEVQR